MATQPQIALFKKKAKFYFPWDDEFLGTINNFDYNKVDNRQMSDLIQMMFESYRFPKDRLKIIEKLNNLGGDQQ